MMKYFKLNRTTKLASVAVLASVLSVPAALAGEEGEATLSTSLTLGSGGLGLNMSGLTPWSFIANDQIQWRVGLAGAEWDFDKNDDVEISRIDYVGDMEGFELRAGLDWYPSNDGWSENTFISGGLMYVDGKFDAKADDSRVYYVGNTLVSPGDVNSFNTLIESSQVMPYLSVGWGNKITGKKGFDFHAELGFRILTEDVDVKVTADDPSNFLSASAIATEKKQIENAVDGPIDGFGMIAVSYHF